MKGIKVVDVGCEPSYEQFGTCELCFSYGTASNPNMTLEFPDGEQITIDTYWWDWGDYWEHRVDNVVDFSAWLSEQEFSDEELKELKEGYLLINLIDDYNYKIKEVADD